MPAPALRSRLRPPRMSAGLALLVSATACASTDEISVSDRHRSAQERDCRQRGGELIPAWQVQPQASSGYICKLGGGDRIPPVEPRN